MSTPKKPGTRRVVKRRTKVAIGGVSQSAFAGYAPTSSRQTSTQSNGDVSTEGNKDSQGEKKDKARSKDKDKDKDKDKQKAKFKQKSKER